MGLASYKTILFDTKIIEIKTDLLRTYGNKHYSDVMMLPNGVSNHRRLDCLLNRFFRFRSKKTSKLRVNGLCEGNSPVTGEFPHKGPVTRKIFPYDDVIMSISAVGSVDEWITCWDDVFSCLKTI